MMPSRLVIYVDGSSRGNPGPAGIGMAVFDADNKGSEAPVFEFSRSIGNATNNIAEYEALLYALKWLVESRPVQAVINVDSELVYKQVFGEYRIKVSHIVHLVNRVRNLLSQAKNTTIRLIPRDENNYANRLAQKVTKGEVKNAKKKKAIVNGK
jgi:ribonuclease HI